MRKSEPIKKPQADGEKRFLDWEAIRLDFLHSGMSLRRIAEKHGVTHMAVAQHRDADGWVRVAPLVPLTRPRRPPGLPAPKLPSKLRRRQMVARLYTLLDAKMSEIEARMAQSKGAPMSATEAEREARNLNALARLYAKLAEMDEAKSEKPAASTKQKRSEDGADADRLRRNLADRLARLSPKDD